MPRPPEAAARLKRLRGLSWLLDRWLPLPGGRRIGLDAILGLVPGVGDAAGAVLSTYILYEAARLGMPGRVLVRMAGNIALETLVGAVPFAGDVFDWLWQANTRNLALIERHWHAGLRPRPLGKLIGVIAAVVLFLVLLIATLVFLLARGLWALVS